MARGKGRGKGGASKRKAAVDDEPPTKLKREESENSEIKQAITEDSKVDEKETKAKKNKIDRMLTKFHPNGEIHDDYTCMLNQANAGKNNDKFYILQVAKEKKNFICFTRWGVVGEDGQHSIDISKNVDDAIKAFKKKFRDKTKNDWDKRDNFTPHKGKYTLTEIDEESDKEEDEDAVDSGVGKRELVPSEKDCSLPYRTQIMVALIFLEEMFYDQMSAMHLDVKKMPLGKLNKTQINEGLETLIDIAEAIKNKKPRQVLMDLSSKFYTLVPHDFGTTDPPVLESDKAVKEKKEVMLTLSDIELTQSLQKEMANTDVHPILEKYEMLDCGLELMDKSDSEFKILKQYATSCPETRKGPLLDAWRIERKGEGDRFNIHDDIENRKLLWHGANIAVVAAILKAGLRIMPHSGGCLGRGIYFASEHAKSSCYVTEHDGEYEGEKNVGFMFLAEVALGKESSTQVDCQSYTKAPKGYDSVVARGQMEPDPKKDKTIQLDGKDVIVPVGKPIKQKQWNKSSFDQSEYLVYKESQARLRYLLKFSFID